MRQRWVVASEKYKFQKGTGRVTVQNADRWLDSIREIEIPEGDRTRWRLFRRGDRGFATGPSVPVGAVRLGAIR